MKTNPKDQSSVSMQLNGRDLNIVYSQSLVTSSCVGKKFERKWWAKVGPHDSATFGDIQ